MTLAAEKEYAHLGETAGAADHDHDLVHELGKRLDALWRYDQYIANAHAKDDPSVLDAARAAFAALESGDAANRAKWAACAR